MRRYDKLPSEYIQRLKKIYGIVRTEEILAAITLDKPTTFRVNTLKSSSIEVISSLNANSIPFVHPFGYRDWFEIDKSLYTKLEQSQIYLDGKIYVQSIASMVPPLALAPDENDSILDITAAPGSKTTQLAALIHNHGQIIANDVSNIRLMKLKANLQRQGVTNTLVLNRQAQDMWKYYPEFFTKVLADVPCSMEGRIRISDESSYADWSMRRIQELSQKQKWILRSAVSCLKPGGELVYATCTIAPEENEQIIDWILRKEKGSLNLMSINIPFLPHIPGLTTWEGKEFNETISNNTIRILPTRNTEGFFLAKLKKMNSTIPSYLRVNVEGHSQ